MEMNHNQYYQARKKLLPQGKAWNETFAGGIGYKLLEGLAMADAKLDADATQLLREMHPRTAVDLLPEWEDLLGLPECGQTGQTLNERQQAASAKWHAWGSLHYSNYEKLAAGFGYEIKIITRLPHHCARPCNYPLWNYAYNWRIEVYTNEPNPYRYYNVQDPVDDPLRRDSLSYLECILKKYEPAHMEFVFIYTEEDLSNVSR